MVLGYELSHSLFNFANLFLLMFYINAMKINEISPINYSPRKINQKEAFTFLKKLNWPTMYNGTPTRQAIPEGWYVFPIPDSETVNY